MLQEILQTSISLLLLKHAPMIKRIESAPFSFFSFAKKVCESTKSLGTQLKYVLQFSTPEKLETRP